MGALPLQGVRIIDLTHAWAGPHATRLLADFGAEVIRVEYAPRLCLLRGGRIKNQAYNKMPAWFQINRNKCSITLDLKTEKDRRTLRELVKIADVLVENGRTGVAERLGLGYQNLIKINPRLIMMSMAGFGNSGPYASYAGYGATFEALSGIQGLTAYHRDGQPYRLKEMDIINGIVATGAVMTALVHRQNTGKGQHIDFSHMEAASHALIGEHFLEYEMNGSQTLPLGNRHRHFAPQGCYPCRGEDKWIALTVRSEEEWQRFCIALQNPEWLRDPRFASRPARMDHHDELDQVIAAWTINYSPYEAMQILQNQGIPAATVLNSADLVHDPHLRDRAYFVKSGDDVAGTFMGMPFKLSQAGGTVRWRGPDLGRHNDYVLGELLGGSPETMSPVREDEIGTAYDPE